MADVPESRGIWRSAGLTEAQGSPKRWAQARGRQARKFCPAFPVEAGGPAAEAWSCPRRQIKAFSMHQLLWELWVKTAVQTRATNPFSWRMNLNLDSNLQTAVTKLINLLALPGFFTNT